MMLKHLKPGDEFEYVTTKPAYRSGRFLMLDDDNSYLRPVAVDNCRFLFSYGTQKVVRHFGEQEIIKKGAAVKSQKEMNHFIGWKFGVPVKVQAQLQRHQKEVSCDVKLIYEENKYFVVINYIGGVIVCDKDYYSYELIPHKYGAFSPRYPVLQSPSETVFCNSTEEMSTTGCTMLELKPYPTATLNIDGKTIELSAETTAELKKKLEI